MAFPQTVLPLVSEILLNGAWTNITTRIERDNANGVKIRGRGTRNEASRAAPALANCLLKNSDKYFSNRALSSANYGLIGRNTQIRHKLQWAYDQFTRSVSSGWGTSTSGHVWSATGGSATDYSTTGSLGQVIFTSLSLSRRVIIPVVRKNTDQQIDFRLTALPTGADITGGLIARHVDADNHYFVRFLIKTTGVVTLEIASRIAAVNTTIASINTDIVYTANTWLTGRFRVKGNQLSASIWLTGTTPPDGFMLSVTPTSALTVSSAGGVGTRGQANAGNTNVNPTAQYDNYELNDYRFWGEVPYWEPASDGTGLYRYVQIEAADMLRRLGVGAKPLRSALYRTMSGQLANDITPVCYIPMEDSSDAKVLASGIAGAPAANFSGSISLGASSDCAGSEPLPTLGSGGRIAGSIPPFTLAEAWFGQFAVKFDSRPSGNRTLGTIEVPGAGSSVRKLRIVLDVTTLPGFSGILLQAVNTSGTVIATANSNYSGFSTWPTDAYFYNRYYSIIFGIWVTSAVPNDYEIFVEMSGIDNNITSIGTVSISGNAAIPTSYSFGHDSAETWSMGHLGFFNTENSSADDSFFTQGTQHAQAVTGYAGEKAADRISRLFDEENLYVEIIGDPDDSALCGPQEVDTLLNNVFRAQEADQGRFYGARDFFGCVYRTRTSMYNQTPAAILNYADDELSTFTSVDDDRAILNKVTAARDGGSSATVEVTTGALSTQEPPDGVGEYAEKLSWNLYQDSQLLTFAGWRAHKGTTDAIRLAALGVELERKVFDSGTLRDEMAELDLGDLLRIEDLRDDFPPDDLDVLVLGADETLANFEWKIALGTVPADPYKVMVIGSSTQGRLEGDKALHAAVNSSDTTWQVASLSGPVLQTLDSDDGQQWMIEGELVTVTDVDPAVITYGAAGTASTGSSGSRTPGLPASLADGNLVCIFASTRNSGTGVPDTPANWYRFPVFPVNANVQFFGRIKDASWSAMPTVTYTGGAANEDTVAQSWRIAGKFHNIENLMIAKSCRLNASAQNIQFGGIPATRLVENYIVFYLGWKQDDFTSVATVTGATAEIQEASSTAGNDASQVADYLIQTTPANILPDVFTVTGGASAISRAALVAIRCDYQAVAVTRSTNGVSKSHAAGAVPLLWPAPHLGM